MCSTQCQNILQIKIRKLNSLFHQPPNKMDTNAWDLLSSEPKEPVGVLNDKIIMRFAGFLNWDLLSTHYNFDIELLRMYFHRINWHILLKRCQIDEKILREFASYFSTECWSIISENQTLSESFIHDFADKVDWANIALYQVVSGKFLCDHVSFISELKKVHGNNDEYILVITKKK